MRISIRSQIILITLLPVLLIDAFFTYVHINSSIQQAEDLLQSKGAIVVKQISDASEFYLFSGNHELIKHLLRQSIDTSDVIYAAVYNSNNEIIAHASTADFKFDQTHQYFYYRDTIYSQNISEADVFEPVIDTHERKSLGWVHLYITKITLRENQEKIFLEGSIFFVVVLLIAMLLTSLISMRITKPIQRLISHLNKVETGELGAVISKIESNEIGDMQRGFNSMSQSLLTSRQHLDERIQSATSNLTKAITTLEHQNTELEIARDSAQKADRVKSQFLANMSHEIRTPINGIKGFANLILKTDLTPDQTRYAKIINQSTNDLSNIINEVLDFSKLENGKLEITDYPFDLHDLLENTRDSLFAVNLVNTDVDLTLSIYSDTPKFVVGDIHHLRQILINLIGNAIKFTNKGFVAITVYLEDEQDEQITITFKIEDSGIGINKKDQKSLFQAFAQIDSDSNRKYTGTGLGLAISRNLAQLMGGDITLESTAGMGSTFTVSLPFKQFNTTTSEVALDTNSDKTVMIYAFDQHCMNELKSLYNRIGFITEGTLISNNVDVQTIDEIITQLSQGITYIDLIVYDLRHSLFHPSRIISSEISHKKPVIIMHYDQNMIDIEQYNDYQFISVINTSAQIKHQLLLEKENSQAIKSDKEELKSFFPKKILVVDDNPINLTLASELTRMWGHRALEASNSIEAMKLFNDQEFDLILLDIQMPEIDGVDTMRMMRETKPDLKTPIIALSATSLDTEQERLILSGFDAFLSKPLEEEKLKDLLDHEKVSIKKTLQTSHDKSQKSALNYQQTLQQSANNKELVRDIFQLLHREIPVYKDNLKSAIKEKVLDDIAAIVHKLHGITCYTDLPHLKSLVTEYQSIKYSDPQNIFILSHKIIDALTKLDLSLAPYINDNAD